MQSIANGTDKDGSFVTVVRLETKLRATLTEQQKALLEHPIFGMKERQFAEFINKKSSSENRRELNAKQREYERLSKRTAELNALFKRLYEDNVLGRINNEQFRMLSCGYTDEQKSIDAKLPELEKQIDIYFRYIGNTAEL